MKAEGIPKPDGGVRTLGTPTLVDRLNQQALHQVLSPIFEPDFSASSYGFRPGRNAHQALKAARQQVAAGKRWVVDMDLEKFFDRVNHALLMGKLAQKIEDAHVLKLIRRYLEAGMMQEGLTSPRAEGAPRGGPLSPLLSNIVLYSSWTGNWNGAAALSAATPMTATCMCAVNARASGCWRASLGSYRNGSSFKLMRQRARWTSRGGVSF
jgi:group II intron reverse transcriptase/maturase